MKLELNTKDKRITIEKDNTLGDLKKALDIIIPGYTGADDFNLAIGKVGTITYNIGNIVDKSYPYRPAFDWLVYDVIDNVVLDTECCSHNNSKSAVIALKEGTYTIDVG